MAKEARAVITVPGLDCVTCAPGIKRVLMELKGVKKVEAAVMLNKIFVDYDPEQTDTMQMARAIEKTGYKIHLSQVM
jgi:Cd2+/Zn2+-exporting ATPase